MDIWIQICLGILIPFIGTTLGAATVLFFKGEIKPMVQRIFLAFAAGVMMAASVWSLLIPAIQMAEEQGSIAWLPPAIGLVLGVLFLLFLDRIAPQITLCQKESREEVSAFKRTMMLIFAVTLHNIPEGMAVGVVFAGLLVGNAGITIAGAFALAIGIAIQNFPEGAIVSLPLKSEGISRSKCFFYGTLSGIVEPIAAVITIMLTNIIVPILPYLLAFAAGAMIYVVVEELIPTSQEGEGAHLCTIALTVGFLIMMILDVALG